MFGDISALDWFMLFVRWVHAIAAMAWVGGSVFFAFVLRPVAQANPELMRPVMHSIGGVYRELVDITVIALIVSGIILMFNRLTGDQASPAWFIVLGIKLVLAVWMFYLVWRLRQTGFQPTPGPGLLRRVSWLLGYNALVVLGVVVFLLASLLRQLLESGAS